MSINLLIFRNLKKNIKNYYLYVFALIFTVALYFAFVTLQYDPALNEAKGSIKGAAALRAASVLLVGIVTIFLTYANNLFIKRRSKEIGLFQLIGMTKGTIFRILTIENFLIYFSSLTLGVFIGFSISRLVTMMLFKITQVEVSARLHFSSEALVQTVIVFSAIYLLIMLLNYLFIRRQTILSLFQVKSTTEDKVRRLSWWSMFIGMVGLLLILIGYYVSSKLFGGDFTTTTELFGAMIFILASVIFGTYLFYKKSVSFLFQLVRKKKDGYLNIQEVLSLSSIMFRMNSNALLLTIITTVSALSIGLLSLAYITYYSAEQTAIKNVPNDFAFTNERDADLFKKSLAGEDIAFKEDRKEVIEVGVNIEPIIEDSPSELMFNPKDTTIFTVSDESVDGIDVKPEETLLTGSNDLLQKLMPFKDSGTIEYNSNTKTVKLTYLGLKDDFIVSWYYTDGIQPTAIVDQAIFEEMKQDLDPAKQSRSGLYIGIDIKDKENIERANDVFKNMNFTGEVNSYNSQLEMSRQQKQNIGLYLFIIAFLGLAFLVTSGCILYFKQMDESEDEKLNYTILRKLGFTQGDLVKGIQAKQLFSFGIPLIVGLSHGYFAVKSGWFMFGTELWTPMLIVMAIYAALYSVFGVLSVNYYKKIIKEAL